MEQAPAAALCIFLFVAAYNLCSRMGIDVNSRDLFTLPIGMVGVSSDRGNQLDLLMTASTMGLSRLVLYKRILWKELQQTV